MQGDLRRRTPMMGGVRRGKLSTFRYMKILFAFLFCVLQFGSYAQAPEVSATQREQMKKLEWLVGHWKGAGWIEMGPQGRHKFVQTESIQSKLDGLVLIVEGVGRSVDDRSTVHSALALVSYDDGARTFRWRAFTAEGRQTDAEAKVGDGMLEWGFPISEHGRVRFTIKLNDKSEWFEIGEMTQDGQVWRQFFEMTLQRHQ
jgi:hypothetical protein